MADARLGQVNPLDLIGRSAVAPQSNEALAALTKGSVLQTLADKGSLERQQSVNESGEFRTGLPLGLDTRGPQFGQNLGTLRMGLEAGRGASTLRDLANSREGLKFPESSFNLGQTFSQPVSGIDPLTGKRFESNTVAAAKLSAKAKETTGESVTSKDLFIPNPLDPDGPKIRVPTPEVRETTTTQKSEREQKGLDVFTVSLEVLAAMDMKRGTLPDGSIIIYRELPNGESKILFTRK